MIDLQVEFTKMFFPPKKKLISSINYYVGKTSQRFHVRIDQHVPKILKSWFDGRSEKPAKKYFSGVLPKIDFFLSKYTPVFTGSLSITEQVICS